MEAFHLEDNANVVNMEVDPIKQDEHLGHLGQMEGIEMAEQGILKSRFDELGLLKTVWVFRRVVAYSFVICTMNMLDGWQVGVRVRRARSQGS